MENVSVNSLVYQAIVLDYLHLFAATYLYWDHFLTLGTEVEYIWFQPKSWNMAWFFINRYFNFLVNIPVLALFFTKLSPQSCHMSLMFHQMVLLTTQLVVCTILTLRVYALYLCNKRVLFFLICVAVVLLAVATWSLIGQKNVFLDQVPGCHLGVTQETAIRVATPWEVLFVYDSILFAATMTKTYRHRRQQLPGGRSSLFYLLFRDGAIYYGVMIFANLANLLTFYNAGPILRGCLSTFSSCVSVTMVSRFLLNIHKSTHPTITLTPGADDIDIELHASLPS